MGVYLLQGAGPSTTGVAEDVRSVSMNVIRVRIDAIGSFAGSAVIIEHSPDGGTTWIQMVTLTTGQEFSAEAPFDLIRARTDSSLTGNATVVMEVSG